MLYAIVSDIHANLPAWRAVLADLTTAGAERIICLGDVVGYGPQPREVLASLYRHVDAFVMGNHDAVACGRMTPERFNSQARVLIEWTSQQLSRRAKEFIDSAALSLTGDGFTCVHGELGQPGAFHYLMEPSDTDPSWEATDDALIFVGHTHRAGLFVRGSSGVTHPLPAEDFILEAGKRYIVNVGSVGYPRDGDPRAAYCLYDSSSRAVYFRRVHFDYEALMEAVREAGLEEPSRPLLKRDPVSLRRPVRDQLEFDPASKASQMVTGVTLSRDLALLHKSNRRWRNMGAVAILLASLMAGVAGAIVTHFMTLTSATVPEKPLVEREAIVPSDLIGNLLPPLPYALQERQISGWRYTLSRPEVQRFTLESDFSVPSPHLKIHHQKRALLRLEAPDWLLNGVAEGRLRSRLQSLCGEDFVGTVKVVVVLSERDKGSQGPLRERTVINHALPLKKFAAWEPQQQTMEKKRPPLRSESERISYAIEADFSGTLSLADISLVIVHD